MTSAKRGTTITPEHGLRLCHAQCVTLTFLRMIYMTDEERLQRITALLIIVRDNLMRGMSKSIQKLQAREINNVLGQPGFMQSPKEKL